LKARCQQDCNFGCSNQQVRTGITKPKKQTFSKGGARNWRAGVAEAEIDLRRNAMDGYERRALFRRKIAIQAFDALSALLARKK